MSSRPLASRHSHPKSKALFTSATNTNTKPTSEQNIIGWNKVQTPNIKMLA